jgi:HSP20 family molecular chaperone IbpA
MDNKKDLTIWSGSPVSRLLKASRFGDMFREFDEAFRNWDLDMKTFTDLQPKATFPKINVAETDETYEVEIATAGFDQEDVSLELKDNCLCVKADKQEEVTDEGKKYLMKEISSRSFRRALNLPSKVMTDGIECTHKDGVIKCVLKKEAPVAIEDGTVKIDIR